MRALHGSTLRPAVVCCHDCSLAGLGDPAKPSHISKTVPSTVHFGPPDLIKSRTFTITFTLAV